MDDDNNDDVKLEEHKDGEETDDNEENIACELETESGNDKSDNDQINSMINDQDPNSTLILTQQDGQICILLSDEIMENPENLHNFLTSLGNNNEVSKINESAVIKPNIVNDNGSCNQEDLKKPKSTTIMSNLATNIARKSLVNDPLRLNALNTSDNAEDENESDERAKQQQLQNDEKRIQEISEKPMNLPYDSESLRSMIERSRNELLLSEEMALLASDEEEPHLEVVQPLPQMPRPRGRPRKQVLPPHATPINAASTSQTKNQAQELLDIEFDPPSEPMHPILPLTRRGRRRKIKQFPDSVVDADLQHIIGVKSEKHDRDNDYRHFPYDEEFEENSNHHRYHDDDDDADYLATRSELEFDPEDDDDIDDDVPIAEEIIEDSHLVSGPRSYSNNNHHHQFTYLTRPPPRKRGRKSKAELAAMAASLQRQRRSNQYLYLNNVPGHNNTGNLSSDGLMFDYMTGSGSSGAMNITNNHHFQHQQQQQQNVTKQILFEELSKKIMLKKNTTGEDSLLKCNSIDSLEDEEMTNHTSGHGDGLAANVTTDMDQSSFNYDEDGGDDDDDERNIKSEDTQDLYKDSEIDAEKMERIRKAEHNKVERRRRDRINNYICELHKILPHKERLYNSKSKGAILRSVYEHYKKQCDSYKLLKEKYKVIANQNRMKDMKIRELVKEKDHLYQQLTFINQSVSSTILGIQPNNTAASSVGKSHDQNTITVSQQPSHYPEYKSITYSNTTMPPITVPITTNSSSSSTTLTPYSSQQHRINNAAATATPTLLNSNNTISSNINPSGLAKPIKLVNISNNTTQKLRLLSDNNPSSTHTNNNPVYRRFMKRENYD